MNISKDGKTIYFSEDELQKVTDGDKKVYVTKRINEKEKKEKIEKNQKRKSNKKTNSNETRQNDDSFSFDNEIVIGINQNAKKEKNNRNKNNINNKKERNYTKGKYSKDIKKNEKNKRNIKIINNNQKRQSKRIVKKIIVSFFGIIAIIIAIVVFALVAPIFNITQIDVTGTNHVSKENVINLSGIKTGENIFKINKKNINSIKENSYIDSAEFKRKLPSTVQINITERIIKYQINVINSYIYIDKNGYILENSTVKKEVPIIVGLKIDANKLLDLKRLDTDNLKEINNINKIADAAKSIEIENIISTINIENKEEYIIYIESQNKKIYIGDAENLTNKMLYVKKILENEKDKTGSIFVNGDISGGFRPFFREENI